MVAKRKSIYGSIISSVQLFLLQCNIRSDQSLHAPPPLLLPNPASYIGQHCDVTVASISLNLKDLRNGQDDAIIGLDDSAN